MALDSRPLPPLIRVQSADGGLAVTWAAGARGPAHLIVALRPLEPDDTEAFWSGGLDSDLIRAPVELEAAAAKLWIPAGRMVSIALIPRDPKTPPLAVVLVAAEPAKSRAHSHAPAPSHAAPSIQDGPPTPAPSGLPWAFVNGEKGAGAVADLAARLAAGGAPKAAPIQRPAGFGARPRWSLARLAWTDRRAGPLRLLRRTQFLDASTLEACAAALPPDAIEIPADADHLVDGLPNEGRTVFYAVFRGPAPWRPLRLSPVPPPFDGVEHPALLGDVAQALARGIAQLETTLESSALPLIDLTLHAELVAASVRCLPENHATAQHARALAQRWTDAPRF